MKTENKQNDTTSQNSIEANADTPRGLHTDETTSIAEICASVMKLVGAVNCDVLGEDNRAGENQSANDFTHLLEDQSDAIWDSICEFAGRLVQSRAASLDDIAGKINVWRHLAPETGDEETGQTIDETLALSIMDDVERLRLTAEASAGA